MNASTIQWNNIQNTPPRSYICGYCNNPLASEKGWYAQPKGGGHHVAFVYVCHHCLCPTFFDHAGKQTPGIPFGNAVHDIPERIVNDLYNEARNAMSVGSYTAAVLCCRKLLMHIAVEHEAQPGLTFVQYVEHLADRGFVPPHGPGLGRPHP